MTSVSDRDSNMCPSAEFAPQSFVIVYLAIKRDHKPVPHHRLPAAVTEVDNRQPPVPECTAAIRPSYRTIGAAQMHPVQRWPQPPLGIAVQPP